MARKSSIEALPSEIRTEISRLKEQGRTIDEILSHLQQMDVDVSRSALGRHSKKLDQIGEMIRHSRTLAEAITDKFGSEDSSKVQRANLEMMHALIQQLMVGGEDGAVVQLDPKDSMFLATALEKLGKADKSQIEARIKVAEEKARQESKDKAAETVVTEGRRRGLSEEIINDIKANILGVK